MRSIVQHQFGGPETLVLAEAPEPTAADLEEGQVLVRVAAAGVNPIDAMTRAGGGMAAAGLITVPYTPGWDLAGAVEAVGPGVTDLAPGQRVLGLIRFPHPGGTYAPQAIVPAEDLVPAPENLNDFQAAALPMAAMTAWQAFAETTDLRAGQRVLITGAGGGVGHLAVQLAHHRGAHVIAVASAGKHEWLRMLGADETLDYHDTAAMTALAAEPVDVALSLAAGSRDTARAALRPGGVLIGLGAGAGDFSNDAAEAAIRYEATHVRAERSWLQAVTALAAEGHLVPTVTEVFALSDAADAHRALENGHSRGKIVLRIAPAPTAF